MDDFLTEKPTSAEFATLAVEPKAQIAAVPGDQSSHARELQIFRSLYELSLAMTADHTLERNLQSVVDMSRRIAGTDVSFIAFHDDATGAMSIQAASGNRTNAFRDIDFPVDKRIGATVLSANRGAILNHFAADTQLPDPMRRIGLDEGLVAGLVVPVRMADKTLGVLYAFNRHETSFTKDDLDSLSLVANMAAVEIHRRRIRQDLERFQLALEDRVTERTALLTETNDRLRGEIVERKKVEGALRESEARFQEMARHIREVFWLFDWKKKRTIYTSPAYEAIWGRPVAGIADRRDEWEESIHPEDRARARASFQRIVETGGGENREYRIVRPDGGIRWVSDRGFAIRDAAGQVIRVTGIAEDITERKKAEEETRARKILLESILDHAPDAIVTLDPAHRVIEWNPGAEAMFGYTRAEAVGRPLDDLVTRESACEEAADKTRQVLSGNPVVAFETVRYRKNGTRLHVIAAGAPIMVDGTLTGVVAVYTDISALKTAQQETETMAAQLRQAQKMEAIGTLAGGIAHDFNNLLMGIQGRASLMLSDDDNMPSSAVDHLKGIEEYVRRATDLTKQILGFARGGKYEVAVTDPNRLIEKSLSLFGRTRKEINIHTRFQTDACTVDVDRGQIEQVLLNLYVNAWQAMPNGGDLYVSTTNTRLSAPRSAVHGITAGMYVDIAVTDTGIGMDADTLARIFDPFFTTKTMGGGTGLGLASAYGIIKNHNGCIEVASAPGKGTTFHIFLPAATQTCVDISQPGSAAENKSPLTGTETVLIVDDEAMILEVGKHMLEALGYRVLTADSGERAVAMYTTHAEKIDMVILDMIMPGVGGGETFDRLKAVDPGVAVVLSSGYSINGQAAEIIQRGCRGFIQKPFTLKQLSEKIRSILDAP